MSLGAVSKQPAQVVCRLIDELVAQNG